MSISGVISETIDVTSAIHTSFDCIYMLDQISFSFWRLFKMSLSWHATLQHWKPPTDYV